MRVCVRVCVCVRVLRWDHVWWQSDGCLGPTLPQDNPQRLLLTSNPGAWIHILFLRYSSLVYSVFCTGQTGTHFSTACVCSACSYTVSLFGFILSNLCFQVSTLPQRQMNYNNIRNTSRVFQSSMTPRCSACMRMPTWPSRWVIVSYTKLKNHTDVHVSQMSRCCKLIYFLFASL